MTVVFMFLEDQREPLECVRMIFRATKEVEKEIYRYVKDGNVIEIAALLMVAREEVTSPSLFKDLCDPALKGSMSLRQLVLSEIVSLMASETTLVSTSEEVHDELNNKLETMMSMFRLIEVFERAGDKIELYRQYVTKWSEKLLAAQIAFLLISEGLAEYKDFELKSHHPYLNCWTPEKSTFKLVYILCLPQLKEYLESIRLVACKTEEIEAIGCNLVRQGKLIELASLLMVAPEKFIVTTPPGSNDLSSNAIRQCIMSDLQALVESEVSLRGRSNSHKLVEKEMKLSALLLLEVFERAGNSINHYLHSDTYNEGRKSRLEIAGEIQNLLEKAGFVMKPKDTDLNDIKCFSRTSDPVDDTSLPSALRPHEFSVAERGSRLFHTMVQGNSECCGPRVSIPTSKALKPGIPKVSGKNTRWFLSLGIVITKVIKRL
ncbi:uncharacterized protein LOC120170527 isoform X4 [Hibiscus syriacus]|uniref:uncharacterized protein LOC120170527 isoform X4 n=1 Tax=Hibiscus syriacus TaxID=106335 RepID=UPI0019238275|nr:uncharacterized protein LOC120170527 isoform X4 [Hibiscus syriacus]